MSHSRFREWIELEHDGLLPETAREALARHLAGCEECRTYRADFHEVETLLQRELAASRPRPSVPPAAIRSITSQIQRRLRLDRAWLFSGQLLRSATWAGLTIGAVFGLSWIFKNSPLSQPEPGMQSTQTAAAQMEIPVSETQEAPERTVSPEEPGFAPSGPDLRLSLGGATAPITDIAFSPDGQTLAAASEEGMVYLWRLKDGALLRSFMSQEKATTSIVFSQDGRHLVTGGLNGEVNIFLAKSGARVKTLLSAPSQVRGLRLSPGGDLIAVTMSNYSVTLVRMSDGQQIETFESALRMDLNASPDRNSLLIASAENAIWLHSDDQTPFNLNIQGQSGKSLDVVFSPQRNFLASSSTDGLVYLWKIFDITVEDEDPFTHLPRVYRTITGNLLHKLSGHTDWVNSLAFTGDSRFLISGGEDGAVILWDPDNGSPLFILADLDVAVNTVAIDPADRWVASGADDNFVRIWSLTDIQ